MIATDCWNAFRTFGLMNIVGRIGCVRVVKTICRWVSTWVLMALKAAEKAAGPTGIRHEELTTRVFSALNLPIEAYASNPLAKFQALAETQRALRSVLGYRLYRDLKRGWRVTSPNLEQCGLLEIRYLSLNELCEANDEWKGTHPALAPATPETRRRVAKGLLDCMRREVAINASYL